MVPSRVMALGIGLVLALAISVVGPVYVTGSEESSDHSDAGAADNPSSGGADSSGTAMTSSQETKETEATSPELTLAEKLQARLQQLEEREQRIQNDEQRLGALRRDLEQMAERQEQAIAEALAIRKAQQDAGKDDGSEQSLKHLIKVYEAMDPEEAALRISKMKESLALDILAGIKDKKAAGMLAGIEPTKAAKLTEGLRFYHQKKPTKATP